MRWLHDFYGHVMHHWHQCHVMLTISSITALHSFDQDNQNDVQHDFFGHVMHHWHQCHVMLTISSIAALHSFDQDNQNVVQHDFFGHVMPLTLASNDANSAINGTIVFLRSRQLN